MSVGHLLDTSALSHYVHRDAAKRYPRLVARVEQIRTSEGLAISSMTQFEMLRGLRFETLRGQSRNKLARVQLLLAQATILPIDPVLPMAAELWARARAAKESRLFSDADLII